jgi:hypothetical protein
MQGGAMEGLGLPSELTSRPFTVAQGREAGLRLRTLRSTRLHVPTHGVRMISTPATVQEKAAAFALGLPDDAPSPTSAPPSCWACPYPRRWRPRRCSTSCGPRPGHKFVAMDAAAIEGLNDAR